MTDNLLHFSNKCEYRLKIGSNYLTQKICVADIIFKTIVVGIINVGRKC